MATSTIGIRKSFFDYVFGDDEGYVCIATQKPGKKDTFKQTFFNWPSQKDDVGAFVTEQLARNNVWFCVNLLSHATRKKEYCKHTNLVWADLDTADPHEIDPMPQCIIQSSPGRWQALWRLDQKVDPFVAEEYSKKIAYANAENGADPSGWDLTQLLRVPFTINHKYDDVPEVTLEAAGEVLLPVAIFEALPTPERMESDDPLDETMPDLMQLPNPEWVLYKYGSVLNKANFRSLYYEEPDEDWSGRQWNLINICIEGGLSKEETFALALAAKCNKYHRDNRPIRLMWREVVKADSQHHRLTMVQASFSPLVMPEIITSTEAKLLQPTIIDRYREWGIASTDAYPGYHDITCFILLSSLIASNVYCHVAYQKMVPNIWGLLLGDSTLTRKTTAMNMGMSFINEIDRDIVLATDGSVEGMLDGLSKRPNMTSIFYKDEVSGFLDSITKKDYLAGMRETFTGLYDVPEFLTRRLRKETISLVKPVFIFFGGGIRDKVYSILGDEDVLSGFVPRFLVVTGEADLSLLRRTGPPTEQGLDMRENLLRTFSGLYNIYSARNVDIEIAGQKTSIPATHEAKLTPDAWERYGDIEMMMVEAAHQSPISMLALPTFERLSRSLLKMSVLLAASRQEPTDGEFEVDLTDIMQACKYIQSWGNHTIDLISNVGRSITQRKIDLILSAIRRNPGIYRSAITSSYHLTKREMDEIQSTLLDRAQITAKAEGRGTRYWAVG